MGHQKLLIERDVVISCSNKPIAAQSNLDFSPYYDSRIARNTRNHGLTRRTIAHMVTSFSQLKSGDTLTWLPAFFQANVHATSHLPDKGDGYCTRKCARISTVEIQRIRIHSMTCHMAKHMSLLMACCGCSNATPSGALTGDGQTRELAHLSPPN